MRDILIYCHMCKGRKLYICEVFIVRNRKKYFKENAAKFSVFLRIIAYTECRKEKEV